MRNRWMRAALTLALGSFGLGLSSAGADTLPPLTVLAPTQLDPRGTFLNLPPEDPDDIPPLILDLNDLGLSPGDVITIEALGAYQVGAPPFSDNSHNTLGAFSASSVLLDRGQLSRVQDILPTTGTFSQTSFPFVGSSATNIDIEHDFHAALSRLRVPTGATHLFVGVNDSFFSDNTDPNNDYQLQITRPETFGVAGTETLVINSGTTTLNNEVVLARDTDSSADVTVTGSGTRLEAPDHGLTVGLDGEGSLTVSEGGTVESGFMSVGRGIGGERPRGLLTVTGAGSQVRVEAGSPGDSFRANLAPRLRVGNFENSHGEVTVSQGGRIVVDGKQRAFPHIMLGVFENSVGIMDISGSGAEVRIEGETTDEAYATIGQVGIGQVTLSDNASFHITGPQAALNVGRFGAHGNVPGDVDPASGACIGTCVQVLSGSQFVVEGTADASSGESWTAFVHVGRGLEADAIVRVAGAGSTFEARGKGSTMIVGRQGKGTLLLEDGASASTHFLSIGQAPGGWGLVRMHDASNFDLRGIDLEDADAPFINVGRQGYGRLEVSGGSRIDLSADPGATFVGLQLGRETGSHGVVDLDNGSSIHIDSSQVRDIVGGSGYVRIGRGGIGEMSVRGGSEFVNDEDGTVGVGISDPSSNGLGEGYLTVEGTDSRFDAGFQLLVAANPGGDLITPTFESSNGQGTVRVDDGAVLIAENIHIGQRGELGGNGGSVVGDVFAFDGGVISPGASAGDLHLTGDLNLSDGGILLIEFASATEFDVLTVDGQVDLAGGTVAIHFLNDYLPQSDDPLSTFLIASGIDFADTEFVVTGVAPEFQFIVNQVGETLVFDALSDAAAVPVPAPAWLLLSAMAGLARWRARGSIRTVS